MTIEKGGKKRFGQILKKKRINEGLSDVMDYNERLLSQSNITERWTDEEYFDQLRELEECVENRKLTSSEKSELKTLKWDNKYNCLPEFKRERLKELLRRESC